jgi:ATP-dependent DNA helicase PIF1
VDIPDDLIIKDDSNNPISAIIDSVYPNLTQNLDNLTYLQERAILAPTHECVEKVNEELLSLVAGDEKIYFSSDSICKTDMNMQNNEELYSTDFLNSIKCSGLPNHILKLKLGVPVMLLRNIDQQSGLCNGTRLVITQMGDHIIEAKVISGSHIGHKVFVPRMILSPSDTNFPFKLQRTQFPLVVCFAMTINKSQGQSLSNVGIYLPKASI